MAYTKYKEEYNKIIHELIVDKNYNDTQCIQELGISKETFYQWLKEGGDSFKSDFSDSYKKAKEIKHKIHIEYLEKETNKHISGYFVEEQIIDVKVVDGIEVEQVKKLKKWVAGNGTVLIHEKKNADPKRWNESTKIEADIKVESSILDLINSNKVTIEVTDDEEL